MSDTTSAAPSDAEIEALAAEHLKSFAQFSGAGDVWVEGEVAFARAVLAKWGAPPAVAGEPVMWAYQYSDGSWHDASATEHSVGMKPLYSSPHPTQAQAGAVPLNHKNIEPVRRFLADRGIYLSDETTKALIVAAHGIGTEKGDSNG